MTRIVAICFGILLSFAVQTQAQSTLKFGHINSTQLISLMPETKLADSTLQKFGASLENQLKTMTAEYQGKITDFKSKEASMADPIRDAKLKEISDLEERIQSFQESIKTFMCHYDKLGHLLRRNIVSQKS